MLSCCPCNLHGKAGNEERRKIAKLKNSTIEFKKIDFGIFLDGAIDLLQCTDSDKNLPVHLAIENGHLELVQLCIDQGKKAGMRVKYHVVSRLI